MQQAESVALRQQLAVLTENFTQLGGQLSQAARELQDTGTPPSAHLTDDLATCRSVFTGLCGEILTLAQTLAVSPLPMCAEMTSLSKLDALLKVVAQAEEKKIAVEQTRLEALGIVEQVLSIHHSENAAFRPLLECQVTARELYQALSTLTWPNIHPDMQTLADRKHPLASLLSLVDSLDELDDEKWGLCQDIVEQAFGKALAIAASRGRLGRSGHIQPAQPAVQAIKSPSATAGQPLNTSVIKARTGERVTPVAPLQLAQSVQPVPAGAPLQQVLSQPSAPLSDNAAPPISVLSALNAVEKLENQTSSAVANGQAQVSYQVPNQVSPQTARTSRKEAPPSADPAPAPIQGSAQDRAALILNGRPEERPTALRDLIYQLLLEDKLSLAFHMTRCLGAQFPDVRPRLPVWLLRSIVLARHVQGAGGSLAQLLKEDLSRWSQDEAESGDHEWVQAIGNWSIAATLQPALFGSQTRAPAVLHAVQLGDDFPQLSAYCRLIGDFGNKHQPLDPVVFRKRKDQTAWQKEIDSLRQTVESWWNRAPRVSLAYEPATKVWRKWQEPRGLLHSLLLAIRQNDPTKLLISQQVIEKLSDDAELKREVQHTDRDILERVLGDDIGGKHFDQLRGLVREAVGFARHWIELQEVRPSRPVPKQAEQLGQEVRKRHEAVLEELRAFQQRNPSLVRNSSVVCCQNALRSVWNFFTPGQSVLAWEEPQPRVLLGEDLLRVPFVNIDEKGEVSGADPESVVDVVLDLLANGLLDEG